MQCPNSAETCVICLQKLGLVFVAVYQSALKLAYVERLLERVKHLFEEEYTPNKFDYALFEATFRKELEKAEKATEIRPKAINPANGNLIHRKVSFRLYPRAWTLFNLHSEKLEL